MKKAILSLLFVAGCGQYYPGPTCEDTPSMPECDTSFNEEYAVWAPIPFSAMRYALTDTLGYDQEVGSLTPQDDPLAYPIAFLDANASALGEPNYELGLPGGEISSLGFKVWYIASSSVCGLVARRNQHHREAEGYDGLYIKLLGRAPRPEEVAILDELSASFASQDDREAAVCATVIGSLEFLSAN